MDFLCTYLCLISRLLHLVVSTNHDCYVKLVVSGLDYSMDGMPRYVNYRAEIFVMNGRVFDMHLHFSSCSCLL
jgi:hypothetical protein